MTKKFRIKLDGAQTAEVDGIGFLHAVDGIRISFFVHKAYDSDQLCVSHTDSGVLVTPVADEYLKRNREWVGAAREAVDRRAHDLGPAKLKQALLRLQYSLKRSPL